jgi:hypothetical protein
MNWRNKGLGMIVERGFPLVLHTFWMRTRAICRSIGRFPSDFSVLYMIRSFNSVLEIWDTNIDKVQTAK